MIISVGGLKGGVSRSTTCIQLATYFSREGYKTIIIDTDTNQSCANWSGIRPDELPNVTVVGMLDNKQLSKNIKKIAEDYEIVILDGSPTMSAKASYLILLADLLIIPMQVSLFDIQAQEIYIDRYLEARDLKGEDIPAYFLLSMYNPRMVLHREFRKEMEKYEEEYGIKILKNYMEYRNAYRLSIIDGKSALEYTDRKAVREVEKLGKEITQILKDIQNG